MKNWASSFIFSALVIGAVIFIEQRDLDGLVKWSIITPVGTVITFVLRRFVWIPIIRKHTNS